MQSNQLKAAREKYAYIPAHVRHSLKSETDELSWATRSLITDFPNGWSAENKISKIFPSSLRLDSFHQDLLQSRNDEDLLHGLISVIFWGNISDPKGGLRPGFALSRSKHVLQGRGKSNPQDQHQIIGHLKRSRELLSQLRISDALLAAMEIKFLGMSFASKVLTFMNPEKASIYDNVISLRLRKHPNEELRSLFVSTSGLWDSRKAAQANIYQAWCSWCSKKADELNSEGLRWQDWDSTEHNWRAVDIERAFFALGRDRE